MKRSEKARLMMDQISQAYGTETVKHIPEIQELLLSNAKILEKSEDCGLVATRICKGLALYALSHTHDFPEVLADLHTQLKVEAVKYDATAMTALLLPIWF
ncbi:bacteriocin immunity protein [Enterococcus hermanniensis]|uniref:Bacteriocin immunity protein n=1 Tax=Enterococcus hermanniensis TaxID=249189 RepID=A0A1L8TMH5_9ENTE|nr:bacteriocin immunity protein [Enterococcus hermanniensis]OJG45506.1 hypothetical protein RV04_GL002222 [Enterococcus hermanniensis]